MPGGPWCSRKLPVHKDARRQWVCENSTKHNVLRRKQAYLGASIMLWLEPRHTHTSQTTFSRAATNHRLLPRDDVEATGECSSRERRAQRTAGLCTGGIRSWRQILLTLAHTDCPARRWCDVSRSIGFSSPSRVDSMHMPRYRRRSSFVACFRRAFVLPDGQQSPRYRITSVMLTVRSILRCPSSVFSFRYISSSSENRNDATLRLLYRIIQFSTAKYCETESSLV